MRENYPSLKWIPKEEGRSSFGQMSFADDTDVVSLMYSKLEGWKKILRRDPPEVFIILNNTVEPNPLSWTSLGNEILSFIYREVSLTQDQGLFVCVCM